MQTLSSNDVCAGFMRILKQYFPGYATLTINHKTGARKSRTKSPSEWIGWTQSCLWLAFVCVFVRVCAQSHTHQTNTCRSLSHILCCSLIVFIRPASHSCLIGNTSPVGSLSTWWDYVCTFVYVCFCLWLCVYFCLAPTTANSWERPADRCSRRGFVCLSLCLNIYFSCLVYFGGWRVFFPLGWGGGGLISQTGNPAALQQIFWWDRLFPRFPRKGRGCQIIVVIPLQLASLTMIQRYWCISNTCSRFLVFATQDGFTYTTAKRCLLCSQQYGWQDHWSLLQRCIV